VIKGLGVCLFGKDGMFESTFCKASNQIRGACLEACIIIYQMCCKANYQTGVYLYININKACIIYVMLRSLYYISTIRPTIYIYIYIYIYILCCKANINRMCCVFWKI
jgi:hypothetical protein